jgi:hypothetical protein
MRSPPPSFYLAAHPDEEFDCTLALELHMTLDAVRAMPNADWLLLAAALKRRAAVHERALRRGGRALRGTSGPSAAPSPSRRLLP